MSSDENKLYDVIFPNDNNPFYINYGYFTGGNSRALSLLKSKIRSSYIDPVLIEDDSKEGSFFVRVLQKDIDIFLDFLKPFKYKEKKIPKKLTGNIHDLFGDN